MGHRTRAAVAVLLVAVLLVAGMLAAVWWALNGYQARVDVRAGGTFVALP
jgi:hypothetical protein